MTDPENFYSEPVFSLMALGKPEPPFEWLDYSKLGITVEHEDELLALLGEDDFSYSDDEAEIWIPLHAWRALAQIRSLNMLTIFCPMLWRFDDQWIREDSSLIVQIFGPFALPLWLSYLSFTESAGKTDSVLSVVEGLALLGQKHIEARQTVSDDFTQRLARHADNDERYNAFLVLGLERLRAKNALPIIAAAYADETVDETVENWRGVSRAFRLPPGSTPEEFIK